MFSDTITSTPFHNTSADMYFSRIDYRRNVNTFPLIVDDSFLSTLRAFVYPRMTEDDTLKLNIFEGNSIRELVAYYYNEMLEGNSLSIISIKDISTLESIELSDIPIFNEYNSDSWKRVEKVTSFFRKTFEVRCYSNPDIRSSLVFVNNLDLRKFHYLQCGILAYLPWFFDKDAGISEDDRELIESLRDKSPERYMRVLEKMAKPFDFRALAIRKGLKDFEIVYEREKIESTKSRIDSIIREMDEAMMRYSTLLSRKRELDIMLLGLTCKIEENTDHEVMDYFLSHKNLHLADFGEAYLDFAVTGYLVNFDEDAAENYIGNQRSIFYTNGRTFSSNERKMLLTEIFLNQNFRLRLCSAYRINMIDMNMDGLGGFDYRGRLGITDCLANPHIDGYRCLGDYKREMNKCLGEQNYIGAIETAIASCSSLNLHDGAVLGLFTDYLFGGREPQRCIELPNGEVVTPGEAINYLKENAKEGIEDE